MRNREIEESMWREKDAGERRIQTPREKRERCR